jgi:hypothetical protein
VDNETSNHKTVILGDEYDDALRTRLFDVLRGLGAQMSAGERALAGSQDLETCRLRLDGAEVVVEAETYIGLSLSGPADIVDKVTAAIGGGY